MRSYIKIYGPSVLDAIKALEKLSIDMPQVCIMDALIYRVFPGAQGTSDSQIDFYRVREYLDEFGDVPEERCHKMISKSGESLGDYDFFFEWFEKPSLKDLNDLIVKIDDTLKPLNVLCCTTGG
jgi:hypothetical protein